jgi:tetratricopeptide (TPR) repeat protein
MELLIFFMKAQAKIDAHNRKTELAKQALLSEVKNQLVTARDNGDETGEISLTLTLGNIYAYYSEFELSDSIYRQGLANARQLPNRKLEAVALVNLGLSQKQRLEYKQAYSYYQKASKISREINDKELEANIEEHINELVNMLDIDKLSKE